MKTVTMERTDLQSCVKEAQRDYVVVTRAGKPVALVSALDEEQLALGQDPEFWAMIQERRKGKTLSRAELEARLTQRDRSAKKVRKAA